MEWIKCTEQLPEDIPENESFGVEYEILYLDDTKTKCTAVTEWLWDRTWNWEYPVIAWREINIVIPFPNVDLLY